MIHYKGAHNSFDGTFNEDLARYLFYIRDEWSLVSPVSLTEDVLKKLGFEKETYWQRRLQPMSDDYMYIFDGRVRIGIHGFANGEPNEFYTDCQYAHQLQNLFFGLTGEELNAEDLNDVT